MLRVVGTSFCQVVMLDEWDAPPSRFYAAYSVRGAGRWILGHPVVDEFATISSPIFVTPRSLLGKIYNAGISLGHLRDAEMALDSGWPPLCVGVDLPPPDLPADWEQQLLEMIQGSSIDTPRSRHQGHLQSRSFPTHDLELYRLADAVVVVVSAALLPRQLARVCEAVQSSVAIALSVGNRIVRSDRGQPGTVRMVSEATLLKIVESVDTLGSSA